MKLYYAPGACSLAANIVAHEAGLAVELVKVDLGSRKTATGEDFRAINPRGYVPTVQLDDGQIICEVAALVQWMADQAPQSDLLPPAGGMARVRVQEWLTFIGTELHKSFSPWLWHKETAASTRETVLAQLELRFAELDGVFARSPFLAGDVFTVADAYAFTILNWTNYLHIALDAHPHVKAFLHRVGTRPKVQAAMAAEGLKLYR